MVENRDHEVEVVRESSPVNRWLAIGALLLFAAAGIAVAYGYRQQSTVSELTSHQADMNSSMSQLQNQVSTLTAKLNDMTAAQEAAAKTAAESQAKAATTNTATARRRAAADQKRLKELQDQIAEQKKSLEDTQQQISQTRSDLEGNISSTRDELNGSIARTHEELVELQRKGEREYFEFDLSRSKDFRHAGPIMLSLRGTDPKHKRFDLTFIVDDNQMDKKRVNLYEPIWIHTENNGQPLQVVVNKIDKNRVHGYVSAPKYKQQAAPAAGGDVLPGTDKPVSKQ